MARPVRRHKRSGQGQDPSGNRSAFAIVATGLFRRPMPRRSSSVSSLNALLQLYRTASGHTAMSYGYQANRAIEMQAIGRASCRERVCQYVKIRVVEGALTKKKKIKR